MPLFGHREYDIMGALDETFAVTEDHVGEHVVVELRMGGATQEVIEANKKRNTSTSSWRTVSRSSSMRSWRGSETRCACSTSTSWRNVESRDCCYSNGNA